MTAAERSLAYYQATVLPLRSGCFSCWQPKRDATLADQRRLALLGEYWTTRNELERLLAGKLGEDVEGSTEPSWSAPAGAASRGH